MHFPNMDEEDGDFNLNSAARSRLSSLFQGEPSTNRDVNQALTFTAPKQPRKNDNPQSNQGTFKLIHAAAVHGYRLKDGNYVNQGKLGCAILGLHESSHYKFLLYKGKQVQVTSCSIVPTFKFHLQANNYINFYDEKNENWSLNFDSETVLIDFVKQIALAKANSEGINHSTLIIQDLLLGEGPSVESGDLVEVRYTGWLLTNCSFGQVFDDNMKSETAFRLRLGKSKVIKGWSEGMVGAQKGSKRLLIIPPNLAYGSEGMGSSVPPNSTLIFETLVTKVKVSRESSHSPSPIKIPDSTVPEKKPEVLPRSSFSQEDNIRMRGASISEQLTQSPKKDKAQLISRMAKMGTATLPLQGAVPAQVSSESENEEEEHHPESPPVQLSGPGSRTASPKPFSKPASRKNSGSITVAQPIQPQPFQENLPIQVTQHSSQISLYSQAALPAQQAFLTPTTTFPYQHQMAPQFQVPQSPYSMHAMSGMMPPMSTGMADAHLPLLMSETRTQNAEMRLTLTKIADKVDTVIQKVDNLQEGRAATANQIAPFMDSMTLVQNIQRIVQENKQLKEDTDAKNGTIQSLNEKICDLYERNQGFFKESSNMLEQKSDSLQAVSALSQAKLLALENEKERLSSELSNTVSKLTSMESEMSNFRNNEARLQQRLREYEEIQKQSGDFSEESKSLINSLQGQIKEYGQDVKILSSKLEESERQCNDLLEFKSSHKKLVTEVEEIKHKSASELSELKDQHGKEIIQYQERLQQARSVPVKDESSNDKLVNEIEILKSEKEAAMKQKNELISKTEELNKRIKSHETSDEACKKKILELQSELENALAWKKKYEIFYGKTRELKERYEDRISGLTTEVKRLQASGSGAISSEFSGELKKVMNVLYKMLQGKFEPNTPYSGSKVLETTLQAIRGLTLQMLERKRSVSSNSSEKSDDSGRLLNAAEEKEKLQDRVDIPKITSLSRGETENDSIRENGLGEHDSHSEVKDSPLASAESEQLDLSSDQAEVPKNSDCDTGKTETNLVEDKTAESPGTSHVDSNQGAPQSDDATETSKEVTTTSQSSSKEMKPDQVANRFSPDPLPSSNVNLLSDEKGNKV